MKKSRSWIFSIELGTIAAVLMAFVSPVVVLASPGLQEDSSDWVTVEEMLVLGYLAFFLVAFIAFLIAFKRGMFRNIEEAKYYILTIDEPDYFTPDWAKEDTDDDVDDEDPELGLLVNDANSDPDH